MIKYSQILMEHERYAKDLSGKVFINGSLYKPEKAQKLPVYNPATLEEIGYIADCDMSIVDQAATNSLAAQKAWANTPSSKRGKMVMDCGEALNQHARELAMLMSYETGKALRTESLVELDVVRDMFTFYGGLALEIKGETIPYSQNMLAYTIREPIGVVGAIIPWNVPLMLMATKIAPALVAGNTVVLKPSPEASFCILKAAEIMNQILPPGVLNVVTGGPETGAAIVAHPNITKVAFTGSVESGRKVYTAAANKIIPVTLELGGKSPMIICQDADLNKAVKSVVEGMRFTRQGQSCSAATRLLVHESLHDRFVNMLVEQVNKMKMGDPLDETTDIGTIVSKHQFEKVQAFIKLADEDARLKVHYASQLPNDPRLAHGLFLRPAIITGVTNDHAICQEEIFGPVAAVIKWNDLENAISIANDTDFGLAAGIWTKNLTTALNATKKLEAGFVQVNQYIVFRPSLPFGGFKQSGLGKEASLRAMIEQYTKEKTVLINLED